MGTPIYSTPEAFIGRSLIIPMYSLATLKGIRFRNINTETHLSTSIPVILHISWKELQVVPW
jgi:hypothetical protein